MPRDAAVLRRDVLVRLPGVVGSVNELDLRVSLGHAADGVDVVAAEIGAEIEGVLDRQVG